MIRSRATTHPFVLSEVEGRFREDVPGALRLRASRSAQDERGRAGRGESTSLSTENLRLAASLPEPRALERDDGAAELRSPTCGSRLRTSVQVEADGTVVALSQQVHACAFGQASAALLRQAAIGRTAADVEQALASIVAWLDGSEEEPRWPGIAALAPARSRKSRHAAILLPFRSLAAALDDARIGVGRVVLQRLDDGLDDVAMGAVAAPHVDVRLGVRRALFLGDPFQRRLGVVGAKQGAGVAAASALRQDVDRRVQPDRDRALFKSLRVRGSTKTPPPVAITRTSPSTSRATSRRSPSR